MQRLRRQLISVKDSDATVLVTGETGTGKELVARALHEGSRRKDLPFVAVACGAVVPTLLESEFFGYARGAFTGANSAHRGLLRQADGGTVFLDEISEMPLTLQAKLLRVLQERRVRPLGHGVEEPFSARLVASSSRSLQSCVKNGTFREDLYFRLKVVEVSVPPLRDRRSDILMLAQHFIERASTPERPLVGLTVTAARILLKHDWPGNVRELEHCIWAAAASAHYDQLGVSDLPAYLHGEAAGLAAESDVAPLHLVKRNHILRVLDSVSGNKALASRLLGLDRKTLVRQVNGEGAYSPPARERERPSPVPD
jgi:two-component system response regulator HydG